jgi:hypothetical protein
LLQTFFALAALGLLKNRKANRLRGGIASNFSRACGASKVQRQHHDRRRNGLLQFFFGPAAPLRNRQKTAPGKEFFFVLSAALPRGRQKNAFEKELLQIFFSRLRRWGC